VSLAPDQITAVVLAGGFGTRVKHLLGDLPKPMAPVNGRPFVEWVVRYLAQQKIRRVILSTGYLAEAVEHHFQSQPVAGVAVRCVPETRPLGTAGGFLNATATVPEKPGAWLVLNGDSLVLAPLEKMWRSLDEANVYGAILGVPMTDAARYGTILQDARGELAGFLEKKTGAGNINAGVYLFRAGAVGFFPGRLPLSFETDVFPALLERKIRLKVCVSRSPFLDIGTPESLPQAENFIRQHQDWY
jgi:D-glycero-alpha-D-manno-heptose 1-phosphate guanylyltransferase